VNSCSPTTDIAGHQRLRSANQRKLIVPRYHLESFGLWWFAVAGPSTRNSLPDGLRDPPLSFNLFRCQLMTYFLWNIDEMYSAHYRSFYYVPYKFYTLLTYLLVVASNALTKSHESLMLSVMVSSQNCSNVPEKFPLFSLHMYRSVHSTRWCIHLAC